MSLEKEVKQKINSPRHEALLNIVHTDNYLEKFSRYFFDNLGITEAQYSTILTIKLENRKLTQVET